MTLLLQQALNRSRSGSYHQPAERKEHRKPAFRVTKSSTKQPSPPPKPSSKTPPKAPPKQTLPRQPLPEQPPSSDALPKEPLSKEPCSTLITLNAPKTIETSTELIILDGLSALTAWLDQTNTIATQLGCLSYLQCTPCRPIHSLKTVDDYLENHRKTTALALILSRLSAPVFAYMRILGYNELLGPNPHDALEYAQRSAARLDVPNLGQWAAQTGEEVDRFVFEWRFVGIEVYPSAAVYYEAHAWLGGVLTARAKVDERVREVVDQFGETESSVERKKMPCLDETIDQDRDVKKVCLRGDSPVKGNEIVESLEVSTSAPRMKLKARRTPLNPKRPEAEPAIAKGDKQAARPKLDIQVQSRDEYYDMGLLTPR